MILHQHKLPFLSSSKMADVDLTENTAGTAVVLPIIQVTNTQEVVVTRVRKSIPERIRILTSLANKEAQYKMFPRVVRCLLGKEELTFDKILPKRMHRTCERLHYRNMISYALRAQTTLTLIKLHLAKMLVLQKIKPKGMGDKVRDTNKAIQTATVTFCKMATCYFALSDRLNSENKNVPLDGESFGQYHYSYDRIKKAEKTLDITQKKYQKFVTENEVDLRNIETSLASYSRGKKFLMSLSDFFTIIPKDELEEKLNDLFVVPKALTLYDLAVSSSVDDEMFLTDADFSGTSFFEPVQTISILPSEFEFKEVRAPLSAHFWSSLKTIKNEDEHKRMFLTLVFSDWRMNYAYNINLTKQFVASRDGENPDLLVQCEILLERCLHKRMINQCLELIYHALRVKDKQSLLQKGNKNNLSRSNLFHIENLLKRSINQLRTIISMDYRENFLGYEAKKRELIGVSTEALADHKREISKVRKSATEKLKKKRKEIKSLFPCNFAYLSQVLHLIREKVNFTDEEVIGLVNYFLEKEQFETTTISSIHLQISPSQPISLPAKRSYDRGQAFGEPMAKLSTNRSDNTLEIIKNQAKHLSPKGMINHAMEAPASSATTTSFEFTQKIQFLDPSQIERMTREEIEMEIATIPDLAEAAPVERALLQELTEISLGMKMPPSPQFLQPRISQQPSTFASQLSSSTFVSSMQESMSNTNSDLKHSILKAKK